MFQRKSTFPVLLLATLLWLTFTDTAQAAPPTIAVGSVGESCTAFQSRAATNPAALVGLLYGPRLYSYKQVGGTVELNYGTGEPVILGDFTVTAGSISYKYEEVEAEITQGVNTAGTVITIALSGIGPRCQLTTTYDLPATAASKYPAIVYFSGLIHEIIDFAQYELGAVDCSPFESPMGTCSDPTSAPFTPLKSGMGLDKSFGLRGPAGQSRPSPRAISNTVHVQGSDKSGTRNNLNQLFIIMGQFLDHDLIFTPVGQGLFKQAFPISIPSDVDVLSNANGQLSFNRARFARKNNKDVLPRFPITTVSALLDLSQVYGNTWEKYFGLREFVGGRMRMAGSFLPKNIGGLRGVDVRVEPEDITSKMFATGDARGNENEILVCVHTLFVREHNKVAGELKALLGAATDDETLFQLARRVVIGEWQSIVFREWLPLLLGSSAPGFRQGAKKSSKLTIEWVAAAFRFGHSMVNNVVARRSASGASIGDRSLADSFFNPFAIPTVGLEPYFRGALLTQARNADHKIVTDLREFLFANRSPNRVGQDLVSLNLQRGRDFGVKGVKFQGSAPDAIPDDFFDQFFTDGGAGAVPDDIFTNGFDFDFSDFNVDFDDFDFETSDFGNADFNAFAQEFAGRRKLLQGGGGAYREGCAELLGQAYADNLNDMDLFSAGLCEKPSGTSLLGPTFTRIIKDQMERARDADRHWFTNIRADFPQLARYSRIGAIITGNVRMADIIVRNTALTAGNIASLTGNGFTGSAFIAGDTIFGDLTGTQLNELQQLDFATIFDEPGLAGFDTAAEARVAELDLLQDNVLASPAITSFFDFGFPGGF